MKNKLRSFVSSTLSSKRLSRLWMRALLLIWPLALVGCACQSSAVVPTPPRLDPPPAELMTPVQPNLRPRLQQLFTPSQPTEIRRSVS